MTMRLRAGDARSLRTGLLVGAASVAVTTGIVYALKEVAPVEATGAVYLIAVMGVSIRWGTAAGLGTAFLSAAAWNFFHIPPTGRFTIAEGENWVALAVFLAAAVIVSRLADDARRRTEEAERRRAEAALLADLARDMLATSSEAEARRVLASRLAGELGLAAEDVEIGTRTVVGERWLVPLESGGRRVGTMQLPAGLGPAERETVDRLAPSLGVLLAAARRGAELEAEAIEAAALRRSDEIKTALLRAVSHDLRSPLTAIAAAADGLDAGGDGERELVDVIRGETDRLGRLVADLLDLSRLETGQARPSLDWCSLEEVVGGAIASLGERASAVEVAIDPDLPLVEADAAQLERAVANLLDNAIRHGPGRAVRVRGRRLQYRLRLEISDDGPGIPREDLETIFEPFVRGSETAGSGSGLGLAIARGFVAGSSGRLWAESGRDGGATFVIELPVRVAPRERQPAGSGE
jgi:two-component system, OmpR family, sensor histidine kinase KdpD